MGRIRRRGRLQVIRIVVGDRSERFALRSEVFPDRKDAIVRAALLHGAARDCLEQRRAAAVRPDLHIDECDPTPALWGMLSLPAWTDDRDAGSMGFTTDAAGAGQFDARFPGQWGAREFGADDL
jgi:hypothetical protein